MSFLEAFSYRRKNTFIHLLDPRTKFSILVSITLLSLGFFSSLIQLLLLSFIIFLLIIAKCFREWLRTMRSMIFLLILIFILNYLTVIHNRFEYSLSMTLRFATLTSAFSLFFLTTTPDELALALESSGIPRDYSLMFTLALRFVPTMARDINIVMDALRSRGLELDKGKFKERIKNYGYLLVPLIIYEIRRSLMVAEALEARAYGAVKNVKLYRPLKMTMKDKIISVITLFLSLTITIISVLCQINLPF